MRRPAKLRASTTVYTAQNASVNLRGLSDVWLGTQRGRGRAQGGCFRALRGGAVCLCLQRRCPLTGWETLENESTSSATPKGGANHLAGKGMWG